MYRICRLVLPQVQQWHESLCVGLANASSSCMHAGIGLEQLMSHRKCGWILGLPSSSGLCCNAVLLLH